MHQPTKPMNRIAHVIYPLGIFLTLGSIALISCGDLVNEPEKPATHEEPKHEEPKHEKPPEVRPIDPDSEARRVNEICERERQWAYASGLIDAVQLRLFRKRNLAPVYNTPGERQSGIDSWFTCPESVKMNGFSK